MMDFLSQHLSVLQRGVIGTATSFGATMMSFLPHLETALRIATLVAGFTVSAAMFVSIVYDVRRKRRAEKNTDEK